jgi:TorA maturation chaperone TorD
MAAMDITPLRAWVYDQLAQVFDGDLDGGSAPPVPAGLDQSPVLDAIAALRSGLASARAQAQAQADHVRLFLNAPGGVAAPPYASWYLDGQLMGPATTWAARAYASQGLEAEPGAREPADYIGAELEFMYFLVRHEMAARRTGDGEALRASLASQARFVREHLAHWLPAFIERIRAHQPGAVFAAAVGLLDLVLQDDKHRLPTSHATPRPPRTTGETGRFGP